MDSALLHRAFQLARKAEGRTSPNPMVGAVLVRNGKIVGEGYHRRAGYPHAEIEALKAAGKNARGSDLYINLEPCCHHGRTPPCTDALINAGITNIFCAMVDPNPLVNGKGLRILKRAGIQVSSGYEEEKARRLNQVYIKYITTGKPFVTLKWASSLDGKVATDTGESQWITGEPARRYVHLLRSRTDGILVGKGTVIADNPSLTIRHGHRQYVPLHRIVMDESLSIPATSNIIQPLDGYKTIIATGKLAITSHSGRFPENVELMPCNLDDSGVDPADMLSKLGKKQITSILVEGGPLILSTFIRKNLADRLMVFLAPRIIGGNDALSAVASMECHRLCDTADFRVTTMKRLGQDVLFELYPVK